MWTAWHLKPSMRSVKLRKEGSNECWVIAVHTPHSTLALIDELIIIPFLRWCRSCTMYMWMVSRSLHQGSVSKCGRQDTVRREMWLQKGHYVIHCSQCAQQDKVESEQWIATKESPPWQPGHSRRSSCQEICWKLIPALGGLSPRR